MVKYGGQSGHPGVTTMDSIDAQENAFVNTVQKFLN